MSHVIKLSCGSRASSMVESELELSIGGYVRGYEAIQIFTPMKMAACPLRSPGTSSAQPIWLPSTRKYSLRRLWLPCGHGVISNYKQAISVAPFKLRAAYAAHE